MGEVKTKKSNQFWVTNSRLWQSRTIDGQIFLPSAPKQLIKKSYRTETEGGGVNKNTPCKFQKFERNNLTL